jgi:hypothetical protein
LEINEEDYNDDIIDEDAGLDTNIVNNLYE